MNNTNVADRLPHVGTGCDLGLAQVPSYLAAPFLSLADFSVNNLEVSVPE